MTKQHFQALAEALREAKPPVGSKSYDQWALDVSFVSRVAANFNPRFNRDKFYAAVQLGEAWK